VFHISDIIHYNYGDGNRIHDKQSDTNRVLEI